uniref:Heterogeneous nuclear ribonucleoprotein R n=1 Tax=Scleropages formosus TaxID=113540 RepID=A0A8C9TNP7_SCLFO
MAAEVNGNSAPVKEDEEPMDITVTHTENYQTLIDAGLPQKVAESLDNIFQTGLVAYADLDERAIDALREFNEEGALSVLQQFKESDLSHVQNKSAFLCGVMKTYRQREKQGSKVQESTKGPDESKIKALLERTGYTLDVTTGQRKYGGPPPAEVYSGSQPGVGTEVFVGKIPRDLYEDELVPLFEKAGPIWDLRLMMDPLSGQNRGYAFITFCNKEAAQEAVKLCDNYEIRSGKYLGVCISVANNRLFVGSIPKNKTRESILEDFSKVTEGLVEVILYHQPDDKKKNRGFCFLEYEDHKSAAQARRRLMSGKVKVWGNPVTVEWADPVEEPDPEVMAKVKVLFVRNLATSVTEELLEKTFSQFGKLERVKKLKDYAFVHFEDRDAAVKAMQEMNGKELEGEEIEIVLAKPPDKKRKERMTTITTTHLHGCHRPCEEGGGEAGAATHTPQTTMGMRSTTTITTATTTTTTGAATKIRTTATTTLHLPEAEEATPRGGRPWVCRGAAEGAGAVHLSSSVGAVPGGPGATAGATWAGRGRPTATTSQTPSDGRPTTSRTGGPSPSPSSPCSRGPTIPVTMVTVMTTRSFIRILMVNSGSRET